MTAMVIQKKEADLVQRPLPERRPTRRKTISEEIMKVRHQMSGGISLPQLRKALDGGGFRERMDAIISLSGSEDPDARKEAEPELGKACRYCIAELRRVLRRDEPLEWSDAVMGIFTIARLSPHEAQKAVPELKDVYGSRSIITKLMVVEALGEIVSGIGYPFGIIDKQFLQQLKDDVIVAERMCHQPSCLDRKHHLEQVVAAMNRVIGCEAAVIPKDGSES